MITVKFFRYSSPLGSVTLDDAGKFSYTGSEEIVKGFFEEARMRLQDNDQASDDLDVMNALPELYHGVLWAGIMPDKETENVDN